jgi:hypothetical protein
LPTGPRTPRSTVLSIEDEAVIARVSPPPSAAAGRLRARASAEPPASEPLGLASLLATPWYLAPARSRRLQACQVALQTVFHQVFSHRSGRGPNGRGHESPRFHRRPIASFHATISSTSRCA